MSAPKKIYLSKLVMAGAEILDKPVSDDDVEYIRADVIRNEIERLKEDVPCRYHPYSCASVLEAYEELLSFLSTLESEKPVQNDLEEAADEYEQEYSDDETLGMAFIAGAKWQAEQLLKSSPMPEDTVLFKKGVEEGRRLAEEEQADLFTIVALDAAQRAKEQMMKEAVEGVIDDCGTPVRLSLKMSGGSFRIGDKVHIIIVEEAKK